MLTREKLMEIGKDLKKKLKRVKVDVSCGSLYIREMLAAEKDIMESSSLREYKTEDGKSQFKFDHKEFQSKLVASSACDDKGELIFKFDDYKWLGQSFTASDFEKLVKAAEELNSVKAAEKNE